MRIFVRAWAYSTVMAAQATVKIIIMTMLSLMLKLFDLNNDVRKTSMMFDKPLMIWYKILLLWLPLVNFDENPFNFHYTVTWGPLKSRMLKTAELTVGQKTRTDSPCMRRVSHRRSLLKGLAEIPFMVSWLEGNNVMGKGATSDSTDCSLEGIDKQGWFERMGRTKYIFQSTAPLSLSQFGRPSVAATLPSLSTNSFSSVVFNTVPNWDTNIFCLLSVPFSVFCPLSSMVWEQIQAARRSKAHLHIVWLDLANAYRSLPYLLITFTLEFFHIPASLPQELLCLLHNPGSLHQLAPAGGRDSDGPFHLPDPIHSGVWGYPDGQQAGSLQSQSSVKAASDEFWALHGLCYHSSPGSHMHFSEVIDFEFIPPPFQK